MTIGIYKITNQINGKGYFGQSVDVEERIKKHKFALRGDYHHNNHLQNSWNKYGEENISFKLIKACKERYLDRFEKLYIHLNDTMNPEHGYNKESGGNKNKTCSPETKKKLSEALSGENNPMYGKYGENHPKYSIPPWNKGKHHSPETRKKMSEANKGNNHPLNKYSLWDPAKCHYHKGDMFKRNRDGSTPCKCFRTKYNGKDLPIGANMDFTTCELIHDLIEEFEK